MKNLPCSVLRLCLSLSTIAVLHVSAADSLQSPRTQFLQDQPWPDDKGVHINAHGGGVIYYGGKYYWFGEFYPGKKNRAPQVTGISCYSSTDLYNWKSEGIVLTRDYGFKLPCQTPKFKSVNFQGDKATVKCGCFVSKLTEFKVNEILGFTICGSDKVRQSAKTKLVDGNTVEVWSDKIMMPISICYAWSEMPTCNLFSTDSLPVTHFRTDTNFILVL